MKLFRYCTALILVLALLGTAGCNRTETLYAQRLEALAAAQAPDWIDVQLINYNGIGRSCVLLSGMESIVIHYVGNPGTTAQNNRDYFNQPDTQVSSHFIVGLEGEIIQCLPLTEKSAASNHRNADTLSIEVCHPDETGAFTDATYRSLVKLTAWLCGICGFTEDNIIRHYDVSGKDCPRYFVQHEDAWEQFKSDVTDRM